MSVTEFLEWMAYYEIEPFGEMRADIRAAQICQMTVAPHAKRTPKLGDFLLFKENDPPKKRAAQTTEEHLQKAREIAAAFGVKLKV